jgi:AraC family transcriptional regulator, activator of mtrCDE
LDSARPGAPAIAKDLASVLFVMVLRADLEVLAPAAGLLRLLNQRMTARAVLAILRDPVRAWKLDDLAQTAASPRATLVRAHRKAAGAASLAFLTDLRLGLARRRLSSGPIPTDDFVKLTVVPSLRM